MKNLKALTVLTVMIFNALISYGQVAIEDRFKWTDKKEYLCTVDEKDEAIDLCKKLYKLKYGIPSKNEIQKDSKVPVFWVMIDPDKKSKIVVIYCIYYKGEYDVVYKQMKNEDTYFFSFEDHDGETYDLFYTK